MEVKTFALNFATRGNNEVRDLTEELTQLLSESGLDSGTMTVFCPSSTSGVTTVEFEPGAVADLKGMFEALIPMGKDYAHNATWQDGNGYAHMRAALLGPSITIPFHNKTLTLGTWQQVVHLDFDNRPRKRELVVQVIGR